MNPPQFQSLLDEPAQSMTELLSGISLDPGELLVTQIYRILWEQIVTLKLIPGQLVSEKEVAEALKASKTPVREALIRLEDIGLVSIVPKSGTYVTPIRLNAYIEGCFTRIQLETGAVRRAAERPENRQHIEQLYQILEQQAAALEKEDDEGFFSLDEALHAAFFSTAGIPGVWHFLSKTQADVNRVRHLKRINKIRRGPKVLEDHQRIVNAIDAGDPNTAASALIDHIGSLESEIEQLTSNTDLLTFIDNQDASGARKRTARRSQPPASNRLTD